jgi:hypothetical protein
MIPSLDAESVNKLYLSRVGEGGIGRGKGVSATDPS